MNIQGIKWTDAAHDRIRVQLDGDTAAFLPWPDCKTWHRERVQAWLDQGGVIAAEDPAPTPIDLSDSDNQEKALKALGLVVAQWAGKTPAQLKTAFKAAWDSLP